jgi:UDP-2,3-diacylglucosamine pyrophosphatase LpxH
MAGSCRLEETEELAVLRLSRRLGSHHELRVDLATFAAVVAGGSAAVAILNQATAAVAIALIGLAVTVVTVRQPSPWLTTANDLDHSAEPDGRERTTSCRLRSTGLYREATVSRRSILILVSDLHLTGGTRPSPDEHDPSFAFTQFVEDLSRQLDNAESRIRLVVLGDMLDITRLEARIPPGGAVAASIQRLESIANAHAQLFQALGRFVSAGGELDVVIGNHDLDLAHPEVQERFIGRLGVLSGDPGATRVTFHRWFLYLRDVVYAEHGHRYHDINAVPVPGGSDVPGVHTPAGVPLAAYLESYRKAMSARGSSRMLASELATLTGSLVAWTARQRPHRMAGMSPADDSRLRDAADTGLDGNAILAIDALSAHLGAETAIRVGRTILGPPLRLVLPYGAAAGVLALVLRGTSLVDPAVTRASDAALTRLIRNRRRLWPPPRSTGYALEAAQHLRHALESAGCAVPFYVLGHTHVPTLVALDRPGKPATYLNTGSWTAADQGGRGYPFVRISRIETGHPDAELLWWQPQSPG